MIYEIAGLKIKMIPKYGRLMHQCESYASSGISVLTIAPNPYDEAHVMDSSQEEREYICCGAEFCRSILAYHRFYLHASAIVHDNAAYLFSGPSGIGKSTHTALWQQLFPDSYILNDDKPVIWPTHDQITVWGTPFSGKTDLQVNRGLPLKGICFLQQGKTNQMYRISEEKALSLLLNNTYRPKDPQSMTLLLDMIEQVLAGCNVYEMYCTPSPEAALLSYTTMKGLCD